MYIHFTHCNDTTFMDKITHLYRFSMFDLVLAHIINNFQDICYRKQVGFCFFFADENL